MEGPNHKNESSPATKPHHPEVALLVSECNNFFEEDSATYTKVSFILIFLCH